MNTLNLLSPPMTLLTDFLNNNELNALFIENEWIQAVNVTCNAKQLEIELVIDGLEDKGLDTLVENGLLTIVYKRQNNTTSSIESFSKAFTIPENINESDVSAVYNNGVLRISISKADAARE